MSGAPTWAVGMQKIGPGIYVGGGSMHIKAEEICEALGFPPTPENLDMAELGAIDAVVREYPGIKVSCVKESDADPR